MHHMQQELEENLLKSILCFVRSICFCPLWKHSLICFMRWS